MPLARLLEDAVHWADNGVAPSASQLAREIAGDLERAGSPLRADELAAQHARIVTPLRVELRDCAVYNLPPPTQGLARYLSAQWLDVRARAIDREKALAWPHAGPNADTVWMGAIDREGRTVSFIQSVYWEFGSGVVAVFTRYARFHMSLQQAVSAPRWLLGRTWGAESTSLKLERRFSDGIVARLRAAGHNVEIVNEYDDLMGHAGALVRSSEGLLEGAADPRGNGCAAAY